MGKPAHLLQPYNKLAPKPHLRSAPLLEEEQKGLLLVPASEDPAADSGLKGVSLLKQHYSLLARNTPLAANSEGSILLCNIERHASASAHSESWGVVDLQVYFTGLVRRPHRSSRDSVQQCMLKVSLALTSLDPRWGRIIRAIVMRSLSNSSILKSSCGRVGLSLSGHSCWTPSCFAKRL